MPQFLELNKLHPGDMVSVISPSSGLSGLFPWVHELGLQRLQEIFGLTPKEYPTTRQMNAPLKDRARDIMDAFADPETKAVIAAVGGEDQLQLIKYLDPSVFVANPKPFFGYSDNTHFINFLWQLGIPSYYGGSILTQYAMQGSMHDYTVAHLKHALFDSGEYELLPSKEYNDIGLDWSNKDNLEHSRIMEPNKGFIWDGTANASGVLWGGCVESLLFQVSAHKFLPKDEDLDGTILFIETAEDIPDAWMVAYLLAGFGERGWFDRFQAVLVGRPKAWEFDKQNTPEQKAEYAQTQRDTIVKTVRDYNTTIPIVQNIDFGHTDPQIALPVGRKVRVLGSEQRLFTQF